MGSHVRLDKGGFVVKGSQTAEPLVPGEQEESQPRVLPVCEEAVPAGHLPEVDGLRALAILGVLLFHLQIPGFSLGWTGVELFFVISGFLITRILLESRERPHYFRNFYVRRTLRIFPIYYLIITVYAVATLIAGKYDSLRVMPYYFTYTQTVPQVATGFSIVRRLNHTWTLAIEEQFYLLWPLAVFLLTGRRLLTMILLAIVGALAVRFLTLWAASPFYLYAALPVQTDLLAAGALIAVLSRRMCRAWFHTWGVVAFCAGAVWVLVTAAAFGWNRYWEPVSWTKAWHSPLLLSAMALSFAGLVALAASKHPWLGWLDNRPFLRIGKISYGLYLYHPFVYYGVHKLAARFDLDAIPGVTGSAVLVALMVLGVGLSYGIAELSWRLIEAPINSLKERFVSR
jgi:peptidoglycan/LPS O-acetylase OafA/YrhL